MGLFLFAGNGAGWAFTRAGIGLGALSTDRKTFPVTQATITTQIHESLDTHGNLAAQVPFNLAVTVDFIAQAGDFGFGKLVRAGVLIDLCGGKDTFCR